MSYRRGGTKTKQRLSGDTGPFEYGPRNRAKPGERAWIARCSCGASDDWGGPSGVPLDNVAQKFAQRDEAFTIEGICERVEEPKPAAAPQAALTVWRRRRP